MVSKAIVPLRHRWRKTLHTLIAPNSIALDQPWAQIISRLAGIGCEP